MHALQVMHLKCLNDTNSYFIRELRYMYLLDGPRILTFKVNILALLVFFTKYGTLMCIFYAVLMWL